MNSVGEEIRNRRKQLRMTQAEVAGNYMSISKLSNIENGKILPDPQVWSYLQQKLGLSETFTHRKKSIDKVRFLLEQARTYETAGLKEKAEKKYKEAAELASRLMLLDKAGEAYQKLGELHTDQKHYREAKRCLDKALNCFEEMKDWERAVECELKYSFLYDREEKYLESLKSAKQALRRIPDDEIKLRGAVHYNISASYYRLHILDKANLECERALSYLKEEDGDPYISALILHGVLLKKAYMYLLAQKKHETAKELAAKQKHTCLVGICWHNLGDVAMEIGDYDQALTCFELALEVKEQTGDESGIIRTKTYMAELHYRKKCFDMAKGIAREAMQSARQHRLKTDEFFIMRLLGKIHQEEGHQERFLDSTYKAITLADELTFDKEKIELLELLADYYYHNGNEERCREKLFQAFLVKAGRSVGKEREMAL
ncbi:MAG TPA: helix-turn-helix transcriptional regulator [Bacillales bacterium]|nr:helix-turn-helix transcriptional regulator [Bacillales bacterium]